MQMRRVAFVLAAMLVSVGQTSMLCAQEEGVEGEGFSKGTLKRARPEAGVVAYRPENPGPWWWRVRGT